MAPSNLSSSGVFSGESASVEGRRQPAAVHQAPGERVVARELQRGVAERAAHLALGRDEVGAAGRVQDVLVGRELALAGVGVEQPVRRAALQHQPQLPGQVVRVLHAGVGAARAERRDAMGAVAREQHAAVAERRHAQAGEGVDADPFQLELGVLAEQRLHARDDALGLALGHRVGVPAELEVDAPDPVGLAVQQHGLVRVEGRVEPEPALGGEVGLHAHVGDQEAVAEGLAAALVAEQPCATGLRAPSAATR